MSVAPRRALCVNDLQALAQISRTGDPQAIFRAVETLSAEVIGHTLFTIMQFDAARSEVERVYSSNPAVYPVGGRKTEEGYGVGGARARRHAGLSRDRPRGHP